MKLLIKLGRKHLEGMGEEVIYIDESRVRRHKGKSGRSGLEFPTIFSFTRDYLFSPCSHKEWE